MNIKKMRNVHLYLGVFFAPLLLFFILSGCWQTFGLHQNKKTDSNSNYQPPEIIKSLSQVHKDQRWTQGDVRPKPSIAFRYLILLMSIGLSITTVLGILMAFKYTRPWIVWLCLLMGVLIPCLLLWRAFV